MQMAVNGLISGSVYALLGISWGLIYSTTGTFHFAHALVITVGGYTTSLLAMSVGIPLVLAIVLGILMAALAGFSIEYLGYSRLRMRGAGPMMVFIASLGILLVGMNAIQFIFTPNARNIRGLPSEPVQLGPVAFTTLDILIVAVSWVAIIALWVFLAKNRLGQIIRAVSDNALMATILGVDTRRTYWLVFAIGSGIAGLAAILIGSKGVVEPTMGMAPLFVSFAVTFLGGVGSLPGAILAGYVLGMSENIALTWIDPQWRVIVSFLILLVVIVVKPTGLLGGRA